MTNYLYRAVSSAEKADILQSKRFNIVDWGLEAKQFVLKLNDAAFFQERFKPAHIVKISLKDDYYNALLNNSKQWIDDRLVITIQEEELKEFNHLFVDFEFIS